MSRSASWLVWGAVVVAGSFLSFQIWQRALEPGHEPSASAPQRVDPAKEGQVPATIRGTPAATASQRGSARSQGSVGSSAGTAVTLGPGASGAGGLVVPGAGGGTVSSSPTGESPSGSPSGAGGGT